MMHHLLTFSRLMSSLFIFQAIHDLNIKRSCSLTLYAIFSDLLDGYLARLLKKESVSGAIFDVVTDKCFLYSAIFSILLIKKDKLLLCLILFWMTRDFMLSSLFLLKKPSFKSLRAGKIYTTTQYLFVFFSIVFLKNNYTIIPTILFIGVFFLLGVESIRAYYVLFTKNK